MESRFVLKNTGPADTLRYLYSDLTRLHEVAAPEIVLHPAHRYLPPHSLASPALPIVGLREAQAHEERLVEGTGGTIAMHVESVTANAHFGAVMGVLRARKSGEELALPFCGFWRFDIDGKAVEHWENLANPEDPARLARWIESGTKAKKGD